MRMVLSAVVADRFILRPHLTVTVGQRELVLRPEQLEVLLVFAERHLVVAGLGEREQAEALTVAELSRQTGLEPSTIKDRVARLIADGLLVDAKHLGRGNAHPYLLTADGRQAAKAYDVWLEARLREAGVMRQLWD
ncbi:MAG TPA: winged helix-turn-helix domain-containing protein [Baekduia sp.]|nr:winged helix-turn-helix domain-containing protein [Baekduia sp.]